MWQIGSSLTVYKCLNGQSKPVWAVNVVAQVAERQQLCSASGHLLVVPRFQLDTYCRRMFTVAGRTTWNSLSDDLWDPDVTVATSRRVSTLFSALSSFEALCDYAPYKLILKLAITLKKLTDGTTCTCISGGERISSTLWYYLVVTDRRTGVSLLSRYKNHLLPSTKTEPLAIPCIASHQSCTRVKFLWPDPTRPNKFQ